MGDSVGMGYHPHVIPRPEVDMIRAKISLTLQNSKPSKDNLSKDDRKTLKWHTQVWDNFWQLKAF